MFEDQNADWDLDGDFQFTNNSFNVGKASVRHGPPPPKRKPVLQPSPEKSSEDDLTLEDDGIIQTLMERSRTMGSYHSGEPLNNSMARAQDRLLDKPPTAKSMFPGPAGVIGLRGKRKLIETTPSQMSQPPSSQTQQHLSTTLELTHNSVIWQRCLQSEPVAKDADSPAMSNVYNVNYILSRDGQAATSLFKTPLLIAAIRSIDLTIGLDPCCELVDPTGSLFFLIHRDLFETHKSFFLLPGTVVCIKNMTIFKRTDGKMSGLITRSNMVSIYYSKDGRINVEAFRSLTKDDVRRNAARLNRDEKTFVRALHEEKGSNDTTVTTSVTSAPLVTPSSSMSSLQSFVPPHPMAVQPFKPVHPDAGGHRRFEPDVTSTPMQPFNLGVRPAAPASQPFPPTPIFQPSALSMQRPPLSTSIGRSQMSGTNHFQPTQTSLPLVSSPAAPASTLRQDKSSTSAVSSSSLSKLQTFQAPQPSPPQSSTAVRLSIENLPQPSSSYKQTTTIPPKFVFKPPVKGALNQDCSQSKPEILSPEVTQLLDGLDDDSLFGDF